MSKKKIWSMPIAAFALAVMLASALITTGIVQAQEITGGDSTLEFSVLSNTEDGTDVFTIPVNGFDVGTLTFTLSTEAGVTVPFTIHATTGVVRVNGTLTAGVDHEFEVSVSGLVSNVIHTDTADVVATIVQENRAPVFSEDTLDRDVEEYVANALAKEIVDFGPFASDADGHTLGYSIAASDTDSDVDGNPSTPTGDPSGDTGAYDILGSGTAADSALIIDGSTLNTVSANAITFADDGDPATDEDNEHEFVITVSDNAGETDTLIFTLTVTKEPVDPTDEDDPLSVDASEDTVGLLEANVTSSNAVTTVVLQDSSSTVLTAGYKLYPADSVWKITDGGLVYLSEGEGLDFEDTATPNQFRLTVTVLSSTDVLQGGPVTLTLNVTDAPESPVFAANMENSGVEVEEVGGVDENVLYVLEEDSDNRVGRVDSDGKSNGVVTPGVIVAIDQDADDEVTYSLEDEGGGPYSGLLFVIDDESGQLRVVGELETDVPGAPREFKLIVVASDTQADSGDVEYPVTIRVIDVNEGPVFTADTVSAARTPKEIDEGLAAGAVIMELVATDPDLTDELTYQAFEGELAALFDVEQVYNEDSDGNRTTRKNGYGRLVTKVPLDFEIQSSYLVSVTVADQASDAFVEITVNVNNLDDELPVVIGESELSVPESAPPGTLLSNYAASDDDGDDLTFSLEGNDEGNYTINDAGELRTNVWLDYETKSSDNIKIVVNDTPPVGATYLDDDTSQGDPASIDVTIDITDAADGFSTINVTKANPVPGDQMGRADAAFADSPANYVSTEDANWGTVLRIEVTRVSPDTAGCGADCVIVDVESDSAGGERSLKARRTATQEKGNVFVAAVQLVQSYANGQNVDMGAGEMAYLVADEEDEIKIRFDNTRDSLDVENDAPEIENFAPEHEAAIKDSDVDYTFTVTDNISGIPTPQDLPDRDGDDEYTSVVAMVSDSKCSDATSDTYDIPLYGGGINCGGNYEFRPIVDDKDFDEVDGGFDVETTIAFEELDGHHYVTFIVCDAAGNCVAYDPDVNDEDVALAMVTVDTTPPRLLEARTGVTWNSTANEYEDDRRFIQMVFQDLTALNSETVETDDFVVEGHTVKAVQLFDPDDEDTLWGDDDDGTTPTRFGRNPLYQMIDRTVFIELEDVLAPDETPDVTLVPNGVEDMAGNEQDGGGDGPGDVEADDWIAPSFTVVSLVSPRVTGESEVLAGEGDEVVITLTVDERLRTPRPDITISYVNAPDGCVDTNGRRDIESTSANEARARGEIITGDEFVDGVTLYCAESAVSSGPDSDLKYTIDKVSNIEWVVTINEPKRTGYYNFYVEGYDRSQQRTNIGTEGVAKGSISTDFFKKNGEVNTDDAHFFEGDVNLSKPEVRISGRLAGDKEPTVELTTPLFIGLDFTQPHSDDCDDPADKRNDCMAESAEYAEDNYSSVTVTSFMLNGVDVTDSVKTTDDETFLIALDGIAEGAHEINIQAMDAAGNELDDTLDIEFEVESRSAFDKRLSPGWNLVSLPGEPADSSIGSVFGSDVEVRTVYTYDPVVPGGWMVAVRQTLDSDWQGDLTEITGQRGYWVLSDAIQDWEVSIPRLAGGTAGTGTPIQPPSIPLYAGWNLIPVVDVTGDYVGKISVGTYLNSLDDGLDLARVLSFNTIRNDWETLDNTGMVEFGRGYWVFVREAGTLVPGR